MVPHGLWEEPESLLDLAEGENLKKIEELQVNSDQDITFGTRCSLPQAEIDKLRKKSRVSKDVKPVVERGTNGEAGPSKRRRTHGTSTNPIDLSFD